MNFTLPWFCSLPSSCAQVMRAKEPWMPSIKQNNLYRWSGLQGYTTNLSTHSSLTFILNRQREQPRSERDIISPTPLVVGVERSPFTSRRRRAVLADTQPRRWGTLTGVKKQRVGALSELVAWSTWRRWAGNSRMASGRELKPRSSRKHWNQNRKVVYHIISSS